MDAARVVGNPADVDPSGLPVEKSIWYIESQYGEKVTLGDVAKWTGLLAFI